MSQAGNPTITPGKSTHNPEPSSKIYLYFALPLSLLLLAGTILDIVAERKGYLAMAQSAAIVQVCCVAIAIIGFAILRPRKDSERGQDADLHGAKVSKMEENKRRAEAEEKKNEWLLRLVVVTGLGMCVIVFYSIQWLEVRAIQVAGVGLLAGGATWLIAAVVGFLFGIPHTREVGQTGQLQLGSESQTSNQFLPSTSLEQVSDWLTKIIVGVGLTQLSNIPPKLDALASYVAMGMGDVASHKSFALAICLYFPAAGFLFGFLWARLYMLEAFQLAEIGALAAMQGLSNRIDAVMEDVLEPLAEPLEEPRPSSATIALQASLDETDRKILGALAEPRYAYRSATGVSRAVPELTIEEVEKRLVVLVSGGLAGRTVRPSDKKELWYLTSNGKRALLPATPNPG